MLCTPTSCSIAMAVASAVLQPGDAEDPLSMRSYLVREASRITEGCLSGVDSVADWEARSAEVRRKAFFMLGLDPMPERTRLRAHTTGRIERDDCTVEKITFQSIPGLYVTGSLYLPKGVDEPAPAILYVCGHGGGPPNGSKAVYQHHGIWLASRGYVVLVIDTLQRGEAEGMHHGTYNLDLWHWVSAGYVPGGVEAWNSIRALDYLESRPEVDASRIGLTGRSGGGAYTWYTATLDDRVKVAIPVNSANTIYSHIEQDTLRGHCDCMFFCSAYGMGFVEMYACIAPRPLLILESTDDRIFPRDGHFQVYRELRRLYRLHGAEDRLGYYEHLGGHEDAMDFRTAAYQWFEKWLKGVDSEEAVAEVERIEPDELRVFPAGLPNDERNSTLQDDFVTLADPPGLTTPDAWAEYAADVRDKLEECVFGQWPSRRCALRLEETRVAEREGRTERRIGFESEEGIRLHGVLSRPAEGKADAEPLVYIAGADEAEADIRERLAPVMDGRIVLWFWPRGLAPDGERFVLVNTDGSLGPKLTMDWYIQRASHLLGRTVPSMRVYDVLRAIDALDLLELGTNSRIIVYGRGPLSVLGLHAGVMDRRIKHVILEDAPPTHREHSILMLNVLRFTDVPQAAAMVCPMRLTFIGEVPEPFAFTKRAYELCGHAERLSVVEGLGDALPGEE